jgi:hypothetical protein
MDVGNGAVEFELGVFLAAALFAICSLGVKSSMGLPLGGTFL